MTVGKIASRVGLALAWLPGAVGCNQSPYWAAPRASVPPAPIYSAQVQDLSQRTSALDADNRDLHAQLARSLQQQRVMQDELQLAREQLREKAAELQRLYVAKQEADDRVAAIEAATQHRGGATITANTSHRGPLASVELPGLEIRREGGGIHIELPGDRLFRPGGDQLLPDAQRWIDLVGNAILRHYPRQQVSIEGHLDGPVGGAGSHALSAARAVAVLNSLVRVNRVPESQLEAVGHGANHPLVSNATESGRARNRRIEVVIHPTALDGP